MFMKILVGYDDSECSKAALTDLENAGLPSNVELLVLMVTENWTMILERAANGDAVEEEFEYPGPEAITRIRERNHAAFAETENLVKGVAALLQSQYPTWKVQSEALPGFAHWGILDRAREWNPDLIVVGSHGRSLIGRLALGSSSLKILTEARCPVRIGRITPARTWNDKSPQRIVIGMDGSPDSIVAVGSVARRSWRPDSAVRLVTAIEPVLVATAGFEVDITRMQEASEEAAQKLKSVGLHVSSTTKVGEAKDVLLKEAEIWGADAIFIGAKGHSFMERVLLGSVSYAVASRANCSVEIVREATE